MENLEKILNPLALSSRNYRWTLLRESAKLGKFLRSHREFPNGESFSDVETVCRLVPPFTLRLGDIDVMLDWRNIKHVDFSHTRVSGEMLLGKLS